MNYGFVINTGNCIGCHACSTACKSENQVPLGVQRTWVKTTEQGRYPDVTRHFQVTRCNHCANPPCVRSCPTTAMYQRDDGIVEFDPDVCIGCKACIQACPYDAIHIDPDSGTASKCHYCAHRVDVGQEPACVVVCPEHAIIAGDMDDPKSEISAILATKHVTVRKPEQGTSPKLFYVNGNELALHPTAKAAGESFWNSDVVTHHHGPAPEMGDASHKLPGTDGTAYHGAQLREAQDQGAPWNGPIQFGGTAAEQMSQVVWNAQHDIHWHWPIPAYIVTKAAAGGLVLAMVPLILGSASASGMMVIALALVVALMVATNGLLLYDLERPERFLFLLIRPQWRSWVARAAWILTGFTALSSFWFGVELLAYVGWVSPGNLSLARWFFGVPLVPLSLATGTYTAFLFAQAEGRDFWQSPVTPVHMLMQTFYMGALAALTVGSLVGLGDVTMERFQNFGLATMGLSLVLVLFGEFGVSRASELAVRAQREIQWGAWKHHFWGGLAVGLVLPMLLILVSSYLALPALLAAGAGLFAYELAFVLAPQQIQNS